MGTDISQCIFNRRIIDLSGGIVGNRPIVIDTVFRDLKGEYILSRNRPLVDGFRPFKGDVTCCGIFVLKIEDIVIAVGYYIECTVSLVGYLDRNLVGIG